MLKNVQIYYVIDHLKKLNMKLRLKFEANMRILPGIIYRRHSNLHFNTRLKAIKLLTHLNGKII